MNGDDAAEILYLTWLTGAAFAPEGAVLPSRHAGFMVHAIVLADELSLTKAARRLRVRPSKLKGHIDSLEHDLGVPLFSEVHKRVRLTRAGHDYIRDARKSVSCCLHALQKLSGSKAAGVALFLEKLLNPPERVQ
jgi:DNA-binding MarR family transcriptional regulator